MARAGGAWAHEPEAHALRQPQGVNCGVDLSGGLLALQAWEARRLARRDAFLEQQRRRGRVRRVRLGLRLPAAVVVRVVVVRGVVVVLLGRL